MCKDNANRAENIQVYLKCLTEMQLILSKDNANRAENIQVYLKMFDWEKEKRMSEHHCPAYATREKCL